MKTNIEEKEGVAHDILVAAVITALFVPIRYGLGLIFLDHTAKVLSLLFILFAFLISLPSGERSVSIKTSLVTGAVCFFFFASFFLNLFGLCLLGALLIWALRSFCTRASVLSCGYDLVLSLAILLLAVWVKNYHGEILALWVFLLLQGCGHLFPRTGERSQMTILPEQRFARAHASAEAALKRVIAQAS